MSNIRTTKDLIKYNLIDKENEDLINQVHVGFETTITAEMMQHINNDAIKKQFVPDVAELDVKNYELVDPIFDDKFTPVRGLVHRHTNRVLIKPVNVCAIYCRFCFRKEKLGSSNPGLSKLELERCYDYIYSNPAIDEVILTGGDPLVLKPEKLLSILNSLSEIPHIKVLRIHTRIPIVNPNSKTIEMLTKLKISKSLYIVVHINHVAELTESAKISLLNLANNGIPLLSQSVLLKGVNDNVEALTNLFKHLVYNKVKPYYLHQLDFAKGTSHFRVPISEGIGIVKKLKSQGSGLWQVDYVLDIPEGYGKVSLMGSDVKIIKETTEKVLYQLISPSGEKINYTEYK